MRGSRVLAPKMLSAAAVAAGALFLAGAANAADYNPAAPALGKPVVLFSPSPVASSTPTAPRAPVAAARRPAAPVQRIPLDGKPLIPPATLPARLGPPPEPQPALSLETDLLPVAAPAPRLPPAGTTPPAAKSPSG